MARNPRQRRRNRQRKQLKYTRVIAVHVLTADNVEEFAPKLHQSLEDMLHALAAAELMYAEIHITEYFDRYELDLVKKQKED